MTELADKGIKRAIISMFHILKYVKKNMKILIREIKYFKKEPNC